MSTSPDDPWAKPAYADRVRLAESILRHTTAPDERTRRQIDRAVLALQGATIDELREVTD